MDYVMDKINKGEYSLVSEKLAIGKVYKVLLEGNLDIDGYEKGFLMLPKGSGIKKHTHINDVERYEIVNGVLSVFGNVVDVNICNINESHNIDVVDVDTIVSTYKVTKNYIDENDLNINNCFR